MKKLIAAVLTALLFLTSCSNGAGFNQYKKYQSEFPELFDIYTTVVGYAKNQKEYDKYSKIVYDEILKLHQFFDIYHDYDGVNNIKTINDNAGVAPVKVGAEIIDLLEFSVAAPSHEDGGAVFVTIGPVLKIWHEYRDIGSIDTENAKIPTMEELKEAAKKTNISGLVINKEQGTVFLKEKGMSLDVGAVAKGYAAQKAIDAAIAAGAESLLINMGGNVVTHGRPMTEEKERWSIAIQDPKEDESGKTAIMDTIYVNDSAIVTSGDYQRYYFVDGKRYNHIIDPDTLMPAEKYAAVTILCKDSAGGDLLSTQLFIRGIENPASKALIEKFGAEVLLVHHDGTIEATDGFKAVSKNLGGYSAKG